MNKETIFKTIRQAGYNFAKDNYSQWREYFMDTNIDDWYVDSLDNNGHPIESKFVEQMQEQCMAIFPCICVNNDEFYKEFNINVSDNISQQIETDGDRLEDILYEGVEQFVIEVYHNA